MNPACIKIRERIVVAKESKSAKDFRLGRSLGLDDAVLYLTSRAIRFAKLSMRQSGDLAIGSAIRATTYADAAEKLGHKRAKHLRMTSGYRAEIKRAVDLAAKANLRARE